MTYCCPYCYSTKVKLGETIELKERDGHVISIKRAYCKNCSETFFAIRIYTDPEGDYSCIRREELEAKTGTTLKRPVFSKRRVSF